MIDPNAFVSQSSVIGVYGEGFEEMKVKLPKEMKILHHSHNNKKS